MYSENIDIDETHIRLKTDLKLHSLSSYIFKIRSELKSYIKFNKNFLITFDKIKVENLESLPEIVQMMVRSSNLSDVGPMATVAGTISQLSLNYLISKGSKNSIVENGGDIAIINNKKIVCGIYSNNKVIGNEIAFRLKPNKTPLGICTSSGKIGHSISFGDADSVTVIADSSSLADGLATRLANEVKGETSQDAISNALEMAENYKELFKGVLIISGDNIGTIGKLPKLVKTKKFELDYI